MQQADVKNMLIRKACLGFGEDYVVQGQLTGRKSEVLPLRFTALGELYDCGVCKKKQDLAEWFITR